MPAQSSRGPWRSSFAAARLARFGTSAAGPNDVVGAITVDLLRTELQSKLLAHHPCKKTANGMLLPASRLHDRRNGGTRRSLEHRKYTGLLRYGSSIFFPVCGGSGLCWRCGLASGAIQSRVSRATVRTLGHWGSFVRLPAAPRAATTEAPPRPSGRRGRIPKRNSLGTATVPLRSRGKASPFWIILLLVWANPEHGR